MLNKSLLLKVTDISGLLLAPSICIWPGVDISSWPELELLCHNLTWPLVGGRWLLRKAWACSYQLRVLLKERLVLR